MRPIVLLKLPEPGPACLFYDDRRDCSDRRGEIHSDPDYSGVSIQLFFALTAKRLWLRAAKALGKPPKNRCDRASGEIDLNRRTLALCWSFIALGASTTLSKPAKAADCLEVDLKAEETAVRMAEEEFASALTSGDVERVVRLLAEDIVLITRYTDPAKPGMPMRAVGVEMARVLNERFLNTARNLVASITPTNIAVAQSGDLAYAVGDFEFRFELVGYGRMAVRGRNLHIFRKVDGKWKVAVEATMDAVTEKSD
jgi:ketosteroid isomerase-like protein